jgi:hypothetical protein
MKGNESVFAFISFHLLSFICADFGGFSGRSSRDYALGRLGAVGRLN